MIGSKIGMGPSVQKLGTWPQGPPETQVEGRQEKEKEKKKGNKREFWRSKLFMRGSAPEVVHPQREKEKRVSARGGGAPVNCSGNREAKG